MVSVLAFIDGTRDQTTQHCSAGARIKVNELIIAGTRIVFVVTRATDVFLRTRCVLYFACEDAESSYA